MKFLDYVAMAGGACGLLSLLLWVNARLFPDTARPAPSNPVRITSLVEAIEVKSTMLTRDVEALERMQSRVVDTGGRSLVVIAPGMLTDRLELLEHAFSELETAFVALSFSGRDVQAARETALADSQLARKALSSLQETLRIDGLSHDTLFDVLQVLKKFPDEMDPCGPVVEDLTSLLDPALDIEWLEDTIIAIKGLSHGGLVAPLVTILETTDNDRLGELAAQAVSKMMDRSEAVDAMKRLASNPGPHQRFAIIVLERQRRD